MTQLDPRLAKVQMRLEALGHRITSTVRTPAENAADGGTPTSLHLTGHAIDVSFSGHALETLTDLLDVIRQEGRALRILWEVDHFHVDTDPRGGLVIEVPMSKRNDRWVRMC